MSEGEGKVVSETSETPTEQTPEELRREIERTRRELGETVDALSHKADVKQRVRDNPRPVVAVAGGIVGLLVLLRLIRRR
jgi:ElaB/YqjD/DUF883 family membrane-anchored ribosome-binding protein